MPVPLVFFLIVCYGSLKKKEVNEEGAAIEFTEGAWFPFLNI